MEYYTLACTALIIIIAVLAWKLIQKFPEHTGKIVIVALLLGGIVYHFPASEVIPTQTANFVTDQLQVSPKKTENKLDNYDKVYKNELQSGEKQNTDKMKSVDEDYQKQKEVKHVH